MKIMHTMASEAHANRPPATFLQRRAHRGRDAMYVRGVAHLEKRRKHIGHPMLHELKRHDNFPYARMEAFRVGNYVAHRAA